MARARASTTEGRYLAARVVAAKRAGYTNADIAGAYGINERTVRKLVSGETSGRRTFGRLVEAPRAAQERAISGASPSIVRIDIKLGIDEQGNDIVRTVNARVPTIRTRTGQRVTPTPADIFLIPGLPTLLRAEIERLERQYGATVAIGRSHVLGLRPIALRRKPLRIEISGYAQ